MPSTSKKQEIAMQMAAAGKSRLGIPKDVGKEFVAADKAKKCNPCKPERKRRISSGLKAAMLRNQRKNNMD